MQTEDYTYIKAKKIGCDGGGGALGHPLVYLDLEKKNEVVCPYCSRKYVRIKDIS